ncbi:MAG: GNAT family N-acetyltransferase [Marinoscillum sp.]
MKEIRSQDRDRYNQFIQQGLREDAESFRISINDPAVFPTEDTSYSFTLGAFENDQIIGVVSFYRDGGDREKLKHKGWLVRMLVASTHRGKGVGSALIQALIERVRHLEGIERINLTVMSPKAKALYEKLGFVCFAEEPEAVKSGEQYCTEFQMSLKL